IHPRMGSKPAAGCAMATLARYTFGSICCRGGRCPDNFSQWCVTTGAAIAFRGVAQLEHIRDPGGKRGYQRCRRPCMHILPAPNGELPALFAGAAVAQGGAARI